MAATNGNGSNKSVSSPGVSSRSVSSKPAHELDAPPWLRVESTLMATADAIRTAYDERLAHLDLTLSLASLLAYITEFGPINQTRAAEHLGQGRAVTGTQVDKLEEAGMVTRQPDAADRRVWLVCITDSGRDLTDRVLEIDKEFRADLRAGIPRAERQMLAGVLVRLQQNLAATTTNPQGEISP